MNNGFSQNMAGNALKMLMLLLLGSFAAQAQPKKLASIQPDKPFDNVLAMPIGGDSLVSSFMIWIKKEVKPHKHLHHTEQVYIVEGKAQMTLGEATFEVKKGDWVLIPKHTVHSVKVLSKKPLKVVSIQAPHFDGTDRVYIE